MLSRYSPGIAELVERYGRPRLLALVGALDEEDLEEALEIRYEALKRPARLERIRKLLLVEELPVPRVLDQYPKGMGQPPKACRTWLRLRFSFRTLEGILHTTTITGISLWQWMRWGVPAHAIREVGARFVAGHWGDARFRFLRTTYRWIPEDQYEESPEKYGPAGPSHAIQDIVERVGMAEVTLRPPGCRGRSVVPAEELEDLLARNLVARLVHEPPGKWALVPDASRNEVKFS